MPAALIRLPDGTLVMRYCYATAGAARAELRNELYRLRHQPDSRLWWWRCTNNRREHKMLDQVMSRDDRDSRSEGGLSVSEHVGYQCRGYRYIYPVSGRVIGHGATASRSLRTPWPSGRRGARRRLDISPKRGS
jgi:hypothetical protein